MGGLGDISSVQWVVVWHVLQVVVLQRHHKGDEGLGRNIECLQQVSFLWGKEWEGKDKQKYVPRYCRRYDSVKINHILYLHQVVLKGMVVAYYYYTHHKDCVGNSSEGLSVGQFSDPVYVNAPLVNVLQNLECETNKLHICTCSYASCDTVCHS